MSKVFVAAASSVTEADLVSARLGPRSGRLDLQSRLALLAVESLGVDFDALAGRRIGICLAAIASSLSTDFEYWRGRNAVGGPSPTLFAYTLPSAAIGEVAIRFRLTGPNLCFVGPDTLALSEAASLLRHGEADGCVCIACEVFSTDAAAMLGGTPAANACALLLERADEASALRLRELPEFPRDMKTVCKLFCAGNLAG
jgi:3-oxoacyl-(acyl-carrier-protein) synthase